MANNIYLSDTQLAERFSVSRSTIWRWVSTGRLHKPKKLSPGCSRWLLSEIEEFEKGAA